MNGRALNPGFAEAHLHLGGMFKSLAKLDCDHAYRNTRAGNGFRRAHSNLGNVLSPRGAEATSVIERRFR
jgi:hypothetical protein